ncbi:putative Short-chain dehydrogenase/reductase [Vibrio crassostreae]|uniref:SDR family NAD(P)-dependent oxidoreductase n=2 Tax=Vibrio crassostreae TaxID=246167 RepID=UPI001B302F66|nr:SDR family NAD(P)-dependent oxidoreductase [Vibrio crassostreae]CAK2020491.1 putative Short-chain dehydrogenase/reductase [Vibrio crassostreae]CAK2050457.1 putative Short-chain dehydrogenase/reductase [Vibrio crassostreae]CAK2348472.1 putative Short-chain dehydrogenase/reductase [Vibrio crassostreae]CAK2351767.1 putative Short-chain dehydrogenase/reductase [Vibrio crassostreae]CAK2895258.1 putative Short-chain dehydrogenase/reductase [Vibrio crassostreae]
MQKIILITGATDGIGFETAKALTQQGHHLLIHGRNPAKVSKVVTALSRLSKSAVIESYIADLSTLSEVDVLATQIKNNHKRLDILINNAGVYKVSEVTTSDNLDVRFVVNTIAPYLLTQKLLPLFGATGRIVNLSSAAQSTVDLEALTSPNAGKLDGPVYAQSKLALTMWSIELANTLLDNGPAVIPVNPASFLGSKLVKEAYGVDGNDLAIGADILRRAALCDEFASASGQYFDNDSGLFKDPHADALNPAKNRKLVETLDRLLKEKLCMAPS